MPVDKRFWRCYNFGIMEKRERNDYDREQAFNRTIKIVCYVLAAVFGAGTVACVIAYAVVRLDILFIPIALCAVVCMISFTYARVKR